MLKLSNTVFKRINVISISFLVTIGILLNLSASSVRGLKEYNDNFHLIKRHIGSIVIGLIIFNIGKKLSKEYYKNNWLVMSGFRFSRVQKFYKIV